MAHRVQNRNTASEQPALLLSRGALLFPKLELLLYHGFLMLISSHNLPPNIILKYTVDISTITDLYY
jgi:hypothetical protein